MDLKRFSWTISIILVNSVILLSIELLGGPNIYNLLKFGGQYGPFVSTGDWYRIVTSMFVHAGWLHLLFNMYALYYIGMMVEGIYGPSKLLVVYFVSGIVGNLLSQVFYYSSPSVGASGAIFGLVGLLLVATYFRNDFPPTIKRELYIFLLPMVIFNIAYGFIPGTDINNAAHLGGFGTGLLLGYLIPVRQSWGIKKKVWNTIAAITLIVIVASFIGLATNNAMIELPSTIDFANTYSYVLSNSLYGRITPFSSEVKAIKPFDKETAKLKNDLLSYLKNGIPQLQEVNSEYESWIKFVKKRYEGLIGVKK